VRLRLAQAVAHSVVVKLLFTIGSLVADQPLYHVIAKLLLVVLFSFTAFDAGDVVQPVVLVILLPDGLLSVVADQNVGGAAIQVVVDALGQAVAVGPLLDRAEGPVLDVADQLLFMFAVPQRD